MKASNRKPNLVCPEKTSLPILLVIGKLEKDHNKKIYSSDNII